MMLKQNYAHTWQQHSDGEENNFSHFQTILLYNYEQSLKAAHTHCTKLTMDLENDKIFGIL